MKSIITKIPSREAFLKGEDTLKIGYPWLTYGAVIALEEVIKPDFKILEFGSGGSTIFFANNAESVFSFESNENWYNMVKKSLSTKKIKNVEIIYADRKTTSSTVKTFQDNYFDIILVDSDPQRSRRLQVANMAIPKLKIGGFLILDNYNKFGLNDFDYKNFEVYTFDEFKYTGNGTRLCKKLF